MNNEILAKGPVVRLRLPTVLATVGHFVAKDGQRQDPGGFDSVRPRRGDGLAKWFKCHISAACTTHRMVTELGGIGHGHAVEDVCQGVLRVGTNLICAFQFVVIEDFLGAKATAEVEVRWRAGGDGPETGTADTQILNQHEYEFKRQCGSEYALLIKGLAWTYHFKS